jgi:DnaA-homolog protein
MQQLSLDVHLVQAPSFDNFVAGPNAELMASLRGIVAGERPAKCLFIWGESGSGKSHLLDAIRRAIALDLQQQPVESGPDTSFKGVALLDNAETLTTDVQTLWFNTFIKQAADTQAMIIACADQAPIHLALRADLRTRLGSGLVFQLKRLDDDQKAQALRQHAASRQINLPEEVLRYLLRHYPRDIRSLMHILERLDRYAFEQKRALSLPLLRELESQSSSLTSAQGERKNLPHRPD